MRCIRRLLENVLYVVIFFVLGGSDANRSLFFSQVRRSRLPLLDWLGSLVHHDTGKQDTYAKILRCSTSRVEINLEFTWI